MNEKELSNLEHYKWLIENRRFDEYDIMGFLVLIREYLDQKKNPIIFDIANGTAHRKRSKGKIYDSIYFAILNHYSIDDDGHVEGYHGVLDSEWKLECFYLSKQFDIKITRIISLELAVCMFSIIHRSRYETDNKSVNKEISIKGSIEMMTGNNSLSILTSDDINKITICFMKIKNIEIIKKDQFIMSTVETYRKSKFLYLRSGGSNILKVTKRK